MNAAMVGPSFFRHVRYASLLLLGWVCSLGCQSGEQPTLSDEKMAQIIADLHIAEAATKGLSGYRKDSLLYQYYEQIFAHHGVERSVYEQNMRLLAQDEARMLAVFERAEALLKKDSGEQ